jgi:2-polyprenyl-3-methyl-5-hydroxy-6-metoxy-1,4-benzoquinol methylase
MKKTDLKNLCGFCKEQKSEILYSTYDIYGNHYTLNQCNTCKSIFLASRPTTEQLSRAYDESYYGEGEEKFDNSIEKVLDYFRKRRASLVNRYLNGRGKILDVGCGNGRFLSFVSQKGNYEIYGIEMDSSSAKRAARIPKIHLKTGLLKPNDFEPESLDAITLFHVFEHLTEPKETLQIISEILKKKGLLVMSFPNIDSFQSKIFKGRWLHLDPPRHLFFFKPLDFIKLMKRYGFKLIKENHFSLEYNPFGLSQSILNCLLKKREVLYEYLKGNTQYVKEYSMCNLFFQKLFFYLSYPLFICLDFFGSLVKKGATVEFLFVKSDMPRIAGRQNYV